MEFRKERTQGQRGEAGYSWLYQATVLNGTARVVVTTLVIVLAVAFFAWYSRSSNDASPDSLVGSDLCDYWYDVANASRDAV